MSRALLQTELGMPRDLAHGSRLVPTLLCFGGGAWAVPTPRAPGATPSNMLLVGVSVRGQLV